MAKTPKKAPADHLPRRGLYALVADWRKEQPERFRHDTEPDRTHEIWRHIGSEDARRKCAADLEHAIPKLPVDRQHLEAMVSFEQQSAEAIQRLERVAGELQIRLDTMTTLVNHMLLQFNRIVPDLVPGRKRA